MKLIQRDDAPDQLYDLDRDPREEADLAAAQPAAVEALRGELEAWLARHPPIEGSGDFSFQPDAATREQLKTLGYVQ